MRVFCSSAVLLAAATMLAAGCSHRQQAKTATLPTVPPEAEHGRAEAPPVAPATVSREVSIPDTEPIHFDFDQTVIRGADEDELAAIGRYMLGHPRSELGISGHCDERGTVEYNIALGDRRATSARDYLVRLGVEPQRIKTISYGEMRPVDPGHDEQAWAKNRRDELSLTHASRAAR